MLQYYRIGKYIYFTEFTLSYIFSSFVLGEPVARPVVNVVTEEGVSFYSRFNKSRSIIIACYSY